MRPFDDNYLSQMSSGYENNPKPESTVPPPATLVKSAPAAAAPAPKHPAPELFDSIAAYISKYPSFWAWILQQKTFLQRILQHDFPYPPTTCTECEESGPFRPLFTIK